MNKLINKRNILIILIALLIILWILWFYFKNKLFPNKIITQTQIINTWAVNELITKNYKKEFHHLDLRSKNLWTMPDICKMVIWTNYEYDIWSLDLADNEIVEIDKDLWCLKNLSELYLSFNKITEIKNLEWLTFLKKLDLGNNEIKEISWLDTLVNLVDLHLWYNQIISTTWLEKLVNLTSLQLQSNKLEDISNLSNLTKLETLKLEFNKLDNEDIKIIDKLKALKIITVWENPQVDKKTIDKLNELSRKNMK
jgi:hypothetical protein